MTAVNGLRVMKPVKWEHKQMVGILQKWWKAQRDHCGFFIQNIWFSPVWSDWVEPALEVVGEMLWDITRNSSSKQAMSSGIFMHPEKICFMWRTRIFLFSVSLFSSFLFFFLCFALLLSVLLFCAPPLFSSLFLLADQKVFWAFRIISTWKWHILHICNIFDVCVCMSTEITSKFLSDLLTHGKLILGVKFRTVSEESRLTVKYAVYIRSAICLLFLEPFFFYSVVLSKWIFGIIYVHLRSFVCLVVFGILDATIQVK